MPDTGAPHFIPFADPTDLVRDWPALSEDVADAVAAGLTAAGNAGIGSNVVQTVKTDTFSTTSTSFTTVTGMTAAITPSSASSKVLIVAQIATGLQEANTSIGHFKITRGGTDIYIGNADGSRIRAVFGGTSVGSDASMVVSNSIVYLDSPSSTSSVTYRLDVRRGGNGTVFINRSLNDSDNDFHVRGASSLTVIEVAA